MAGGVRPRRRGLAGLAAAAGLVAVGWLAPAPWLADHWPRVLGVVLFLVVFVVPRWLAPPRSAAWLAGVEDPAARGRLEDERLRLQHEVRSGLLQAVAGVAVIAAVVATWQQLDADRRQLRAQLALAGREQAAQRFARAVDQLASDRLDVRLGGIYGLERVAAGGPGAAGGGAYRLASPDDPPSVASPSDDRLQAFQILSAYVRRASRQPSVGPPGDPSLQARLPDVAAAATVLARRAVLAGDPPLDLSGSLLPGARLDGARLAGADLRGADVRASNLQRAELGGARLEDALLCGTQLQGADLRGARLAGARASTATRWPTGFDWRAAGARLVEVCED